MKHSRKPMRLQGFDYKSQNGYFITQCVQNRVCLLGNIIEDSIHYSDAGVMVKQQLERIPERFMGVELDAFVIMPNHIHFILLVNAPLPVGIPQIVQWFKITTTNRYAKNVDQLGWNPFSDRIWQRGYYDHIIRSNEDLERIRIYIENNISTWAEDKLFFVGED